MHRPSFTLRAMRQAGTLPHENEARRLADHLFAQGISTKIDREGDAWAVWVHDEDQLATATRELAEFALNPDDPRYLKAAEAARAVRKQQQTLEAERQRNFIDFRTRWNNQPGGVQPLTMLLIAACVAVAIFTDAGQRQNAFFQTLMFQPPIILFGHEWGIPNYPQAIERGEVWRLVTPMFIHFGMWHLVFNMFWLYDLGNLIESRRGTWRFTLMVLVIAVVSNYAQYFFTFRLGLGDASMKFGGMSGVVYGLFGYVWIKSRYDFRAQLRIAPFVVLVMMISFLLCWSGLLGNIANWAHTAGLVAGAAIAYAPVAWRKVQGQR